jgi:hypothetical protein
VRDNSWKISEGKKEIQSSYYLNDSEILQILDTLKIIGKGLIITPNIHIYNVVEQDFLIDVSMQSFNLLHDFKKEQYDWIYEYFYDVISFKSEKDLILAKIIL